MDYLGLTGDALELVKGYEQLLRKRAPGEESPRLQALLMWVIELGTIAQLRQLLAAGANPNFVYNSGETPLGMVIHWRREQEGAAEFFRELVQAGADPSQSCGNKSLIALAAAAGNTHWAVDVLLDVLPPNKARGEELNRALLPTVHNAALV